MASFTHTHTPRETFELVEGEYDQKRLNRAIWVRFTGDGFYSRGCWWEMGREGPVDKRMEG